MRTNRATAWILSPVAWSYDLATRWRNARFERVPAASRSAAVPIISVGNLTAGGTGKTPLVVAVVKMLQQFGRRPGILTRGYGGDALAPADEVLELREALPGVPVVVDADRVRGAATAQRDFAVDCAVMDDGFQHRRLRRDLDMVVIDALDPWGGGRLLPAGRLRESRRGLARADLIVISRAGFVTAAALAGVERDIRSDAPRTPVLASRVVAESLRGTDGAVSAPDDLRGVKVVAACGIGNPRNFEALLRLLGAEVLRSLAFADHHRYVPADVARMSEAARAARAAAVVTTRKDWVKLAPLLAGRAADVPFLRLDMRVELDDPDAILERLLRRALEREEKTGKPATNDGAA